MSNRHASSFAFAYQNRTGCWIYHEVATVEKCLIACNPCNGGLPGDCCSRVISWCAKGEKMMTVHHVHEVYQTICIKVGIHRKTKHSLSIPISYFFRHVSNRHGLFDIITGAVATAHIY